MNFPTLCLIPERWMGSWVQSSVGCFLELYFFSLCFLGIVSCWVAKAIYKQLSFLTWACAAGFYNINNNNNCQIRPGKVSQFVAHNLKMNFKFNY